MLVADVNSDSSLSMSMAVSCNERQYNRNNTAFINYLIFIITFREQYFEDLQSVHMPTYFDVRTNATKQCTKTTRAEEERTLQANQMNLNYSILKSLWPFFKNKVNAEKRVWEYFSLIADCENAADLRILRIKDFSSENTAKTVETCF